eukprot:COSAG01_NODE_42431_length_440_cov_0.756598_2_plen_45_part_01
MLWYEGWLSYAQREAEAMMNPPPPPPASEDREANGESDALRELWN